MGRRERRQGGEERGEKRGTHERETDKREEIKFERKHMKRGRGET